MQLTKDSRPAGHRLRAGTSKAALSVLFLACADASATSWLQELDVAFDTVLVAGQTPILSGQILQRRFQAQSSVHTLNELAANVGLGAFSVRSDGSYFVPKITTTLDSLVVSPRDVVRQGIGGAYDIAYSAAALGLPANVSIDALALDGSDVLFSIDVQTIVGGTSLGPSDVVRWNGEQLSILYGATQLGIPPGVNITALEVLAEGNLLVGFASSGEAGARPRSTGGQLQSMRAC